MLAAGGVIGEEILLATQGDLEAEPLTLQGTEQTIIKGLVRDEATRREQRFLARIAREDERPVRDGDPPFALRTGQAGMNGQRNLVTVRPSASDRHEALLGQNGLAANDRRTKAYAVRNAQTQGEIAGTRRV